MNLAKLSARARRRLWAAVAIAFAAVVLAGCGGGGSGGSSAEAPAAATPSPAPAPPVPSAPNVAAIVVDGGTDGSALNTPFVSVTVCQPGTSACATIDHVVVDTGSSGLRLRSSAVPAAVALPRVTAPGGAALGECAQFASGFSWGSVRVADVAIAGEHASAIPIQLVDDPAAGFEQPPASCSNTGRDIGAGGGANGIVGVGFLTQDCGTACTASPAPNVYYACLATGCATTDAPLSSQVANPVAAFPVDNNGVAVVLPEVPLDGAVTLAGSLIIGIGTQANNQPGSVQVFTVNRQGNFSTIYRGTTFSGFIDSGSNALFFPDPSLPRCAGGFYCPASPLRLSAVVASTNGSSASVDFIVQDLNALRADATSGHIAANDGVRAFDWGLPFFFGRTVWTAVSGASTPLGPGPFWAF